MEDIAKAFTDYATLLANLKWLKENGDLPADTDIGLLAFQGAIAYTSPTVIAAFAVAMELETARQDELACQPKRPRALTGDKAIAVHEARQQAERDIYDKARALSIELAKRG